MMNVPSKLMTLEFLRIVHSGKCGVCQCKLSQQKRTILFLDKQDGLLHSVNTKRLLEKAVSYRCSYCHHRGFIYEKEKSRVYYFPQIISKDRDTIRYNSEAFDTYLNKKYCIKCFKGAGSIGDNIYFYDKELNQVFSEKKGSVPLTAEYFTCTACWTNQLLYDKGKLVQSSREKEREPTSSKPPKFKSAAATASLNLKGKSTDTAGSTGYPYIKEGEVYVENTGEEERIIDNSNGDIDISRRITITREWNIKLMIDKTSLLDKKRGAKIGFFNENFGVGYDARKYISQHYSVNFEVADRKIYTEEIQIKAPPKAKVVVLIRWYSKWERGVIVMDKNSDVPFRVLKGVYFDLITQK